MATLPGDWRSIQARWELWHTIRTFASIAAVAAATIAPRSSPFKTPSPSLPSLTVNEMTRRN